MTYCVGIMVDEGLVFTSDSRTNAGVDQLSTYSKLFTYGIEGERSFVIMTAGNLATTQAVIAQLSSDIKKGFLPNLYSVTDMVEAAEYVGQVSLAQQQKHSSMTGGGSLIDASATFIFGGQIIGEEPKLFMIYPAGNFISATVENPYQQIGEVKYGRPILDRIIVQSTSLEVAALCSLVSMDSTMRSNATVGPPVEVLIYARDSFSLQRRFCFTADNPYLVELTSLWDNKLKEAFHELHQYNWAQTGQGNCLQQQQQQQ
jgi:putative proteasome-type protease